MNFIFNPLNNSTVFTLSVIVPNGAPVMVVIGLVSFATKKVELYTGRSDAQ